MSTLDALRSQVGLPPRPPPEIIELRDMAERLDELHRSIGQENALAGVILFAAKERVESAISVLETMR